MINRNVLPISAMATKFLTRGLSSSALFAKKSATTWTRISATAVGGSWKNGSIRNIHFSRSCFIKDTEVDPKWAENPKLIPNEEWAKRLDPEQYFCTREGGTEPPFSGQYLGHKAEGIYACVCCGSDLFTSKTKYDSGSGWPSFNSAIEDTGNQNNSNVIRRKDISHGMVRSEILCNRCNAHLGHVFEDGPEPTGERFCVNSAALKFVPKKLS